MPGFGVVKHFDVVEHVAPRLGAGTVNLPADPLTFEQLEEVFSHGIVVTVSSSIHASHGGAEQSKHPTDNYPIRYLALKCEANNFAVVWRA
jgi:hypothetical protein